MVILNQQFVTKTYIFWFVLHSDELPENDKAVAAHKKESMGFYALENGLISDFFNCSPIAKTTTSSNDKIVSELDLHLRFADISFFCIY